MADDMIEWKEFGGIEGHSTVVRMDQSVKPEAATSAYICPGCQKPHVLINMVIRDVQMVLAFDPQKAREIGFSLIAGADRVDPQVKQ